MKRASGFGQCCHFSVKPGICNFEAGLHRLYFDHRCRRHRASSDVITRPFYFLTGIFLCSCLFSAVGLIFACRISSLNQFIIATIPAELIINLPAIAWLFGYQKSWLLYHPGVSLIELLRGSGYELQSWIILMLWTLFFAALAEITVKKMMKSVGGVKL